jgi:hypothetical protein
MFHIFRRSSVATGFLPCSGQFPLGLYRSGGFGLWLLSLSDTGEFAGQCGLTPQHVQGTVDIEVGYHIRPELQGRGYATEAAAACRDYARDVLGSACTGSSRSRTRTTCPPAASRRGLIHERDAATRSGRPASVHAADL